MLKNRTTIGIVCMIISFFLIFFGSNKKNGEEYKEVLILNKDINSGEKITESVIEKVELSAYNLPKNLIADEDIAVGNYITINSLKGDFITTNKISKTPISSTAYLSNLKEGEMAISISAENLAQSVSGKIESGDIVSVIVPITEGKEGKDIQDAIIPSELKYVEVITTTSSDGKDVDTSKGSEEEEVLSTVTLLVNEKQAKILAQIEVKGNMHLALAYSGNDSIKKRYLNEQRKILGIPIINDENTKNTNKKIKGKEKQND